MTKTRNYNPADYAALKGEAKSMDRKELEEFFVKTKDRNYITFGAGITMFLVFCLLMFCVVMVVTTAANGNTNDMLKEKAVEIEKELCPHYNGQIILQEQKYLWGRYSINIDCNK